MPPDGMSGQPRILIVKLTSIGDVVHAMPVACALKRHMPDAFICWLAEGKCGDILQGHRAVDELVAVRRRWASSPSAVMQLRRRLRDLRFDVTLDLQGLTKSSFAARLSGAGRRIGFAGSIRLDLGRWFNNDLFLLTVGREFSRLLNNEFVRITAGHIVERYLQLLEPLGIRSPEVEFNLPRHDADVRAVGRMLSGLSLTGGFAAINSGAGRPAKLWAADRFAEVASHLRERHSLPSLVLWAGEHERRLAEKIVAASAGCAILSPPTSLMELAEVARRARVFISADTGPLHIAAAVGTHCVGLFGTMPPERNGPYGPGHEAIQVRLQRGTSVRRHRAGNEAMLAIDARTVCDACDRIIGRPRPAGDEPLSPAAG